MDQIWLAEELGNYKLVFELKNASLGMAHWATSPCRNWLCVTTQPKGAESEGYDPVTAAASFGLTFVNLISGEQTSITTPDNPTLKVQFSGDSDHLYSVSSKMRFEARKVPNGELAWSVPNVFGVEYFEAMKVSNSEKYLAIGSNSGAIHVTDLVAREGHSRLTGSGTIRDLYLSPDEDTLIAACGAWDDSPDARGELRFFDLESGQTILQLGTDLHTCVGFAFTPDELQMSTVHFDGSIHVWEGASDEEVEQQRTPRR